MGAPLPWFPFYVDLYETDEKVARLGIEHEGVFLRLLCWQWREGSVPKDVAFVARTLHARPASVRRVFRICFTPVEGSLKRLMNPALARHYAEAVGKSEQARRAGLASARKRSTDAGRLPNGGSADVERSRSRIRSEIEKSLSAHAEGKNGTFTPAPADA